MTCKKARKLNHCAVTAIHEDIVQKVSTSFPNEEALIALADLFKVLGDPTRVRILSALAIAELCVCDIAALLSMTQSAISHQLTILRKARLVKNRRDGKVVYYSLNDDHVMSIFQQGLEHINE